MTSDPAPFLCGVVEGFYGRPWNPRQRHQLFDWMEHGGMNAYLYAPKDDPKHRVCWRLPYDEAEAAEIGALIRDCHRHGLEFFYALAPGLDLSYSSSGDQRALEDRVGQLVEMGCRHFGLFFDDIPAEMSAADAAAFGSVAKAQCAVTNRLLEFVRAQVGGARFVFCPTVYCGRQAGGPASGSTYLLELGAGLAGDILICWTGPEIISTRIPAETVREVGAVLRRKPLIWDNLHANDYDLRRLYTGPCSGRAPELRQAAAGILTNPNCQFEANFVPVRTLAQYAREAPPFRPRAAYRDALAAWRPSFQTLTGEAFTLEDLELLGDMFYLPDRLGDRLQAYMEDVTLLLQTAPDRWGERATRFNDTSRSIRRLFEKMTALRNRDLLHAFYPQLWEVKESVLLLEAWVQWRSSAAAGTGPFHAPECRPGIFRGSFAALVERLLPMDEQGGFRPLPGDFRIRRCGPEDAEAAYEVCLKTGDSGQDGTHLYPDAPKALGEIFVGPYLRLEPDLAFVLEDAQGVCGYVLGALDSARFYQRYVEEWLPPLRAQHPEPVGDPASWSPTQRLYYEYYHPDIYCPPAFAPFPSHAHIDLLPRAQGRGQGRRMMDRLLGELGHHGSPGVHLGLSAVNARAHRFYQKLGFVELARVGAPGSQVIYMGTTLL